MESQPQWKVSLKILNSGINLKTFTHVCGIGVLVSNEWVHFIVLYKKCSKFLDMHCISEFYHGNTYAYMLNIPFFFPFNIFFFLLLHINIPLIATHSLHFIRYLIHIIFPISFFACAAGNYFMLFCRLLIFFLQN